MKITGKDPCPCESGKVVSECTCMRPRNKLVPVPCMTETKMPKTNYSHSKCYASETNDCSTKISLEHYISHGILRELANGQGKVNVGGMTWIEGKGRKWLPTGNIAANVLCERHNKALSDLDSIAIEYFKAIRKTSWEYNNEGNYTKNTVRIFNGTDFERWMLKLLIGAVASNNMEAKNVPEQKSWRPPIGWIKVLFGDVGMPKKLGLYCISQLQEIVLKEGGVAAACLSTSQAGVIGLSLIFQGFKFVLAMVKPNLDDEDTILKNSLYRPGNLEFRSQGKSKVVALCWDDEETHGGFQLDWYPPEVN